MVTIILQIIDAFITGSTEYISTFLGNIVEVALYAERYIDGILSQITGQTVITNIKNTFYNLGISLIAFKFLKKGFDKYILWSDGDPDNDVGVLFIGFIKALICAISFEVMYTWGAEFIIELSNDTMLAIDSAHNDVLGFITTAIANKTMALVTGLMHLTIVILVFILYIKMLKTGVEILILKIGFPIACVGLMDKDGGVFRVYLQKIVQSLTGVFVQIACFKLGEFLLMHGQPLWSIALFSLAFTAPKFLQEFIVVGNQGAGGGAMSKMYHTSMMAKTVKGFIK